jgi:glycosyltransferase involved in cell wall biosynthesis
MATYKRAWILPYSLGSLANQSRCPDEVIVVLKPSNDSSKQILEKFSSKLPIKIVIQCRGFVVEAVHLGIESSSGDVILFIDDAIARAGMVSLEAIACGRPVITYVSSEYSEYGDFPLKDVSAEEEVALAACNADIELWRREYAYLEKNHKPEVTIKNLLLIYNDVICSCVI